MLSWNVEFDGRAVRRLEGASKAVLTLGSYRRRVNLLLAAFTTLFAACHPPRIAPAVPAGQWSALLGNSSRSAYASEAISAAPKIIWNKGIDRGFAEPLEVHGSLLLATSTGRAIVTMDAESGMRYWSRRFSGPIAGTALRRDSVVFVATGDRENRVQAISLTRGRGMWSRRVGAIRVEPLLLDSMLVVVNEAGEAQALRTRDGSAVWHTRLGAPPATSPVHANGAVFVASERDTLVRLDARTGDVLARVALPATPSAPPLVLGGALILPFDTGDIIAVGTAPPNSVLWRVSIPSPVNAAPVAHGDTVFVLTRDAQVWRLDPAGHATSIATLGGAASGSLTMAGDRLVVGRLDGMLFLLDLEGQVLWQNDLGDSVVAPVAVHNGVMFVPLLHGHVVRLQ